MRWELVKLFGVPVDSDQIKNINPAQTIWYAHMFNQDRENKFQAKLDITEYLASFINHEAVRQTKEARENKKMVTDDDFDQILRNQFGRDLSPDALATATRAETQEEKIVETPKKKGSISIDDIRKYTGLELDEVKFTPKK